MSEEEHWIDHVAICPITGDIPDGCSQCAMTDCEVREQ